MTTRIMISVPADLLAEFDELADSLGKTRSGLLQELMAERIRRSKKPSRKEIIAMLDSWTEPRGGDAVRLVKEGRPR